MASLVFKYKTYYSVFRAVFRVNSRTKWIGIGKVSKVEANKILK